MLNYTTGLEVLIRVWVNHKRSIITCFNLLCQPSLRSTEWIKINWVDCYHYIFDLFWARFKKKTFLLHKGLWFYYNSNTEHARDRFLFFIFHENKNSPVDIIAVWLKLCLRQIWRCDLWNRTILSTAKAKEGFFNELYRASQSQRIYCLFSSFLLLGNLQMRADISENQSWRGRKDDFV